MRSNPSDDAPLIGFTTTMRKWINITTPNAIAMKSILLETHYKYDRLHDIANFLDMIDKSQTISYLQDNMTSIIVVVSTTHTTK
jgi:hypothetical protein